MNAARFSPIPCPIPEVRKPAKVVPTTVLEPAVVQPCYEGMDDTSDWMVNGGKELLEGMLHVECPEAS